MPPPRAPRTDLSPEERESLGKSLFTDYLSAPNLEEAVGTAQELEAPGFMPKLVQVGGGGARRAGRGGVVLGCALLLAAGGTVRGIPRHTRPSPLHP